MHSLKNLWKAQLELYPQSERISIQEMYRWANEAPTIERKLARWKMIALAMQKSRWIFYRTGAKGQQHFIGCRYGVKASQYVSNYSDL